MRTTQSKTLVILSIVAAIAAMIVWPSVARADWDPLMEIDVPFTFMVENTSLPAGEYQLWKLEQEPNLIRIESVDNGTQVAFLARQASESKLAEEMQGPGTEPFLIFHEIGDKRFLREIYAPSKALAWEALKARTEQEMQDAGQTPVRKRVAAEKS